MINGGYHDNDTSAGPNMTVFVHPSRQPTPTQKMKGILKILISNFAWLSQRTARKASVYWFWMESMHLTVLKVENYLTIAFNPMVGPRREKFGLRTTEFELDIEQGIVI